MDEIGGLGMGGVFSAANQVSEIAAVKGVASLTKSAIKTTGEEVL